MMHRLPEILGLATLALGMVVLVLSVACHYTSDKDKLKGNKR